VLWVNGSRRPGASLFRNGTMNWTTAGEGPGLTPALFSIQVGRRLNYTSVTPGPPSRTYGLTHQPVGPVHFQALCTGGEEVRCRFAWKRYKLLTTRIRGAQTTASNTASGLLRRWQPVPGRYSWRRLSVNAAAAAWWRRAPGAVSAILRGCGGESKGGRRIDNPPQVKNLPHNAFEAYHARLIDAIWAAFARTAHA